MPDGTTQHLARLSLDTAGLLTTAGCRIWSAHAHGLRPVVVASLPPRLSDTERRRILAKAWQSPVAVNWVQP